MASQRSNNETVAPFVTGLLVGGLAAAVTTLLVAPKSGKETREQLLQSGIDLSNDMLESADQAVSQALKNSQTLSSGLQGRVTEFLRLGQRPPVMAGGDGRVELAAK